MNTSHQTNPIKTAQRYSRQATNWINKYAITIMMTASIIYFIYLGTLSILDHVGLRTQLNDLGHMEQSIWQITQGNFSMPISTPKINTSRFAQHANVIFYFIAPLYALFPHPITLLLLGTAAISTAGFLLFWLAKLILKNNFIALIFGISLLLNPLVQETNLYDFHPVVLALPLFLATIIFQKKHNWTGYWISILLLLAVKETLLPLVAIIGLHTAIKSSKKHGIYTILITIFYWLILSKLLPFIINTPVAELPPGRFSYLGNTPLEIVTTFLKNPIIIPGLILQPHTLQYLLYLFIQGGFLTIFSPLAALWSLPNIIFNSLAQFQSHITGVYYSGIVITTMYTAAIYGLCTLQHYQPKWVKSFVVLFALQVIIISTIMSPTPYGLFSTWQDYTINHNRQAFAYFKSLIPPDASLSTQNNLGAHFANRQTIVKYPYSTKRVNYILLHIKDPTYYDNGLFIRNAGMTLFGRLSGPGTSKYYKKIVNQAFQEPDFGVLAYSSPWYLLKRGHDKSLNDKAYQAALMDVSELSLDIARDKREYKSIVNATWFRRINNSRLQTK